MKFVGVLLIIIGILGLLVSTMMFGDIGFAASIGSTVGLISGIGFLKVSNAIKALSA